MTPSTRTVAETIQDMERIREHMDRQGLAVSAGAVRDAIEYLRPLAGTSDALDAAIQAAIAGMGKERTAYILHKALFEIEEEDNIRQVGGTD